MTSGAHRGRGAVAAAVCAIGRRLAIAGAGVCLLSSCTTPRSPRREPAPPLRLAPLLVLSPFHTSGVVVHGAARSWWKMRTAAAHYGEPLPVGVTMYCLQGTTRRGRYVRPGIIAADPKFFPLARYVELYIGRKYLGRFLVDDTGKAIKGPRIDVWTPSCREARRFGVQRGTAVRVERSTIDVQQAGGLLSEK